MSNIHKIVAGFALASLFFIAGLQGATYAQGRGHGGGHGTGGVGMGGPGGIGASPMGRPDIRTSDSGRGRERERSARRADRDDEGKADEAKQDKKGAARYQALASKLGYSSATAMRTAYQKAVQAAQQQGHKLTFGQFVAAHMIAKNLGARDHFTAQDLLSRLEGGQSMGRALKSLGVSRSDVKAAEKAAKQKMKVAEEDEDKDN